VRVTLDADENEGFTAVPYRNEGPRHGFVPMKDQTISLRADADDAQLGRVVLTTLNIATTDSVR